MSTVIPFEPRAPITQNEQEKVSPRRRSLIAGFQMGLKPDFMTDMDEAQPYVDALSEAAREVKDDEVRLKLRMLATALLVRACTEPDKPKKRRRK